MQPHPFLIVNGKNTHGLFCSVLIFSDGGGRGQGHIRGTALRIKSRYECVLLEAAGLRDEWWCSFLWLVSAAHLWACILTAPVMLESRGQQEKAQGEVEAEAWNLTKAMAASSLQNSSSMITPSSNVT